MKKLFLLLPFTLIGCSTPPQQSTVPLDMKAVEAYQQRVMSGNTVNPQDKHIEEELNASDKRTKVIIQRSYPRIYPSIYYGSGYYGSGYRYGVGLGYW
ncbi:hypothetical protein A4G19_01500 [Pasteurellaceae bacterium Macca]|nr:hypothetical protein [Pasteurellaceae bacterium Macca]